MMCFQDHSPDGKNLEKQLVLGETLDWFQQVRVQTELVFQLLLALLQERARDTQTDFTHTRKRMVGKTQLVNT